MSSPHFLMDGNRFLKSSLSKNAFKFSKTDVVVLNFAVSNANGLSTEAIKPLRVSLDTKVKTVVKKLREGTSVIQKRLDKFALVLPKKGENDEIILDEEEFLWNYDISPVETLEWREFEGEIPVDKYFYLKILLPDQSMRFLRFPRDMKVSGAFEYIKNRIPVLQHKNIKYYGLYLNTFNDEEVYLKMDRILQSYTICNLDVIEIKKAPIYEIQFLSHTSNNPESLLLEDSMRVSELIALLKHNFVEQMIKDAQQNELESSTNNINNNHSPAINNNNNNNSPNNSRSLYNSSSNNSNDDNNSNGSYSPYLSLEKDAVNDSPFGLIHIPTHGVTSLQWMREDATLALLQRYDILEFKRRMSDDPIKSTIDPRNPSIKMVIAVAPGTVPSIAQDEQKLSSAKQPVELHLTLNDGEELIETIADVTYSNPRLDSRVLSGQLVLTNYQLIFVSDSVQDHFLRSFFSVPLCTISRIEKIGRKKMGQVYSLLISCRDIRAMVFDFRPQGDARGKIFRALQVSCFPGFQKSFAFKYYEVAKHKYADYNGWELYSVEKEFKRLFANNMTGNSSIPWRITSLNSDFSISPSYPSHFIVPLDFSDEKLRSVAQFRSKGRLPALTYVHSNGASLCRSAQPLVGLKRARCVEDEQLLNMIREINPNGSPYYIVDARPMKNAIANIPTGGGFENRDTYGISSIEFANIANIHAIRESLVRVQNLVFRAPETSNASWLSELEYTNWFAHLRTILEGTARIVHLIADRGASVLVHCSDGWDRTAQLAALAQICLDPHYRTIRGLTELIEKDWLSFGHLFQERIGHADSSYANEQRSPIFVQFVDCLFQLMQQFPSQFEWNEQFLINLLDHLYSCKFGTFLGNCARERAALGISSKTISLWSWLNSNLEEHVNPFFVNSLGVLRPAGSTSELVFWKNYYCRWQRSQRRTLTAELRGLMLTKTIQTQSERMKELERQLDQLTQEKVELLQKYSEVSNKKQ